MEYQNFIKKTFFDQKKVNFLEEGNDIANIYSLQNK
jgi:hypothetical protein